VAELDLSDAFDPAFLDDFVIVRQVEVIDQHGRSVVLSSTNIAAVGVIGPTSPDDLQRLPEGDYTNKAITIVSQTRIQGNSPGVKADEILWHGSRYLVRALDDFTQYGAGFVQAVAVSIDPLDPPPHGTA
jgi:galactose-6-phosphate isomerase